MVQVGLGLGVRHPTEPRGAPPPVIVRLVHAETEIQTCSVQMGGSVKHSPPYVIHRCDPFLLNVCENTTLSLAHFHILRSLPCFVTGEKSEKKLDTDRVEHFRVVSKC